MDERAEGRQGNNPEYPPSNMWRTLLEYGSTNDAIAQFNNLTPEEKRQVRDLWTDLKTKGEKIPRKLRERGGAEGNKLLAQKQNPFWTEEELLSIAHNKRLAPEHRSLADRYLNNLQSYGKDAIAHLCLHENVFNALLRNGYGKISEAEKALTEGTLRKHRQFGPVKEALLVERLETFHKAFQAYVSSSTSTY